MSGDADRLEQILEIARNAGDLLISELRDEDIILYLHISSLPVRMGLVIDGDWDNVRGFSLFDRVEEIVTTYGDMHGEDLAPLANLKDELARCLKSVEDYSI